MKAAPRVPVGIGSVAESGAFASTRAAALSVGERGKPEIPRWKPWLSDGGGETRRC